MKTYIITDPCYLVNHADHPGVWARYCGMIGEKTNYETTPEADDYLSKALGFRIQTASTGYGDWRNSISGVGVKHSGFFADAGLVCVAEMPTNPAVLADVSALIDVGGVAVFDAEEDISVVFDRSNRRWTIVRIFNRDGEEIITSQESNEEVIF